MGCWFFLRGERLPEIFLVQEPPALPVLLKLSIASVALEP